MNVSFLQDLLNTVAAQGRQFIPWALGGGEDIIELSRALMTGRGEASGVALAREILQLYRGQTPAERRAYFKFLAEGLVPHTELVAGRAKAYAEAPSADALAALQQAVESPRQEYFRRINLAPGATADIVAMRRDILRAMKDAPELRGVDADLRHLLGSWFNRGFLVLKRIDWQTPAAILEKIIEYEAVHEIKGWDDLRRRLVPADRRCFGFFHPSLIDEPLIFVEVALMPEAPAGIDEVLGEMSVVTPGAGPGPAAAEASAPTTAVFYSISNCQDGLKGISFGNFLIKQVVEDLVRELPSLTTFVTLSPVPGFARWLNGVIAAADPEMISAADRVALAALTSPGWHASPAAENRMRAPLLGLAAKYFLEVKADDRRPLDPVARFHLGNGARLDRINWLADTSVKGLREAHALMVNYRYDLKEIETNHEAYANQGKVAASRAVRALLRPSDRARRGQKPAEPAKPAAITAPAKPQAKLAAPAKSDANGRDPAP